MNLFRNATTLQLFSQSFASNSHRNCTLPPMPDNNFIFLVNRIHISKKHKYLPGKARKSCQQTFPHSYTQAVSDHYKSCLNELTRGQADDFFFHCITKPYSALRTILEEICKQQKQFYSIRTKTTDLIALCTIVDYNLRAHAASPTQY